ncbi:MULTISPECIES: hypothetical protein [Acinetobacter]|uniref:phage tail terminator protein n=1 Tax=Acinetobacter TaxID=469 RepID=UPI0015D452A8|nr:MULTISPECIES: hypothetical protein [Acinetobacter]MCO8100479.1 hypothetical protein [Acinetobacter indicus]MCO8106017.1 hypothetical protein [Acinetobacter indicus]MCO8111691.1 hypothetical protein [Acinetobacter indicus]
MTTFFAVRDEIAEKLKEIPEFKQIYTPQNSTNITEMSQLSPSAHVNFVRIDLKDSKGNSKLNQIGQQWAVSVACRNAQSQLNDGRAVADEAGALTEKVIRLLAGWQPVASRIPLRFLSVRDGYSSSFAYITIIFESEKFI